MPLPHFCSPPLVEELPDVVLLELVVEELDVDPEVDPLVEPLVEFDPLVEEELVELPDVELLVVFPDVLEAQRI